MKKGGLAKSRSFAPVPRSGRLRRRPRFDRRRFSTPVCCAKIKNTGEIFTPDHPSPPGAEDGGQTTDDSRPAVTGRSPESWEPNEGETCRTAAPGCQYNRRLSTDHRPSFVPPQIAPISPARSSAGTKSPSRQARQERKEKGEQDKNRFTLGDLCVFARDVILLVFEVCVTPSKLSGNRFQLLRVSNADHVIASEARQSELRTGNRELSTNAQPRMNADERGFPTDYRKPCHPGSRSGAGTDR